MLVKSLSPLNFPFFALNIISVLFYQPIFNFLIVAYRFFGENLGLGIIAVALVSRLIMLPFTANQLKNAEKNKEFRTEYEKIQKKYAKNKEKQMQELAKIQSKYLPGQLGGCLPLIFQIIFLFQINSVIRNLFEKGVTAFNDVAYPFISVFAEDAVINPVFLGIDLSKTASDIGLTNISSAWPYILLALAVGASQFLSSRVMSGLSIVGEEGKKKEREEKKSGKKKKDEETPDFSKMMQSSTSQMMYILPIMTVIFSLRFISGLSLYWTIQSFFVIIQQLIRERIRVVNWLRSKFSPTV
ncbi:membrane protein insertase YidC [Candidatus Dojkabacteria bacterium]|nr:membrane protein insertase YidC [Candidatus Dojkabacteria bacterium]